MIIYLVPVTLIWLLLITLAIGIPDGVKKIVNVILIILILLFSILGVLK